MRSRSQHKLPAAIERADSMPALTESRDLLLDALLDDTTTLNDLANAVESDVGLIVGVMRRANAARSRKVATIADAIEVLTPDGVETMARGIATYDFFERLPGWNLPPERFRLHAVSVAGTADMISREIDHPHRDQLVLAAMLHDIGKVVLAEAYPHYAQQMLDTEHSPDERAHAERLEHGIDHTTVGGVLLRRWRVPEVIAHAVERHHSPDAEGEGAVLRLADMLAHYERGAAVRPADLVQAAARLEIGATQLQSLMYRLPDRCEPRRQRRAQSPLSHKEREVLRGLAASKVYKEIAYDLGIAASTVRSHLHSVYVKLGAADRAQAVLVATREGWI